MSKKMGIITIKTVELDDDYLKKTVFNQLGNNETPFISPTAQAAIKKYTGEGGREAAKELWKELLIDTICLLKLNDSREKVYSDIPIDDMKAFSEHFDQIRNRTSHGIDELLLYYDDFVAYESVLYGTEKYYRDHIEHVLQVWGVGIGLIFEDKPVILNDIQHLKFNSEIRFHKENKGAPNVISQSELWAMWTIIALCHDLGYPIEKTSKINQHVRKIISQFGCLSFNELDFSFDLLNSFIVEKFINISSSKAMYIDGAQEHRTKIQHKFRDKFAKSLEDYKHGMFSGLLLFKKLVYFLETDYGPDDNPLSDEDLRQFMIRREILRAICGHTCPKIYHLDLNTLSFLLILCDEIQEWNRPRLAELLDHRLDNFVPTNCIKKFDVTNGDSNKCEVHIESNYGDMKFDPQKNKSLLEALVVKKFKNFNYLLRTAKDDTRRKIVFQWDILFSEISYSFKLDSDESALDTPITYTSIPGVDGKESQERFDLYTR